MFRTRLLTAAAAGLLAAVGTATALLAAPAPAAPMQAAIPTTEQAANQAMQNLSAHRGALRAAEGDEFTVRNAVVDADGARHVRVNRTYHGLKVRGGDAILHYQPDGTFKAAGNALSSPLQLSVTPALDAAKATSLAVAAYPNMGRKGTFTAAELFIDARRAVPVLAWDIAVPMPGTTMHIFVDANTGQVRGSDNGLRTISAPSTSTRPAGSFSASAPLAPSADLVHPNATDPPGGGTTPPCCEGTANATGAGKHTGSKVPIAAAVNLNNPSVLVNYYLKDRLRGGHIVRDANDGPSVANADTDLFTDPDNYWGNGSTANRATVAVDIQYGAAVTWDFYKNTFGRNGIANNGVGARSYAHFLFWDPYAGEYYKTNAGWSDDCFCMVYGDGENGVPPITAVDVAGHEMSHGVTSNSAGLEYEFDAGGLNESTSDIFGTLVEFFANNPSDAGDYKIGEKILGANTPLRWMDDPAKDGHSKSCWDTNVDLLDPHYSSGVGNHFFYMLAVGSGMSSWGNSPTCAGAPAVTGIGNDKAGRIWYQTLTAHMVSTETYPMARQSSIAAANELYGAAECEAVKAAWAAVAVPAAAGEPACGPAVTTLPILANPGYRTAKLGTAVSLQVQATHPLGEALTFTATGLPAGLAMSSSGLITGTPTQVGVTVATVTVTDTSSNTVSAKVTWTIMGSSGCMPSTWLKNRGFESGTTSWNASLNVIGQETATYDQAHDGTWRAKLGGHGVVHTDSLSQSVTMPSVNCGAVNVKFWIWINTDETSIAQADKLTVKLAAATVGTLSNLDDTRGHVLKTYTMTPAYDTASSLSFSAVEDAGQLTRFVVDDVVIEIP